MQGTTAIEDSVFKKRMIKLKFVAEYTTYPDNSKNQLSRMENAYCFTSASPLIDHLRAQ
jgi:hypothetical protein